MKIARADSRIDYRGTLAIAVIAIVLLLLPVLGVSRDWLLYIFLFFIYLALANMWNLLAGYSGLISLCQPAFIGLAGYGLVIATWSDLPWYAGVLGGAVVAAVFAVVIAFPTFRMKGIYFAIASMIVPEIFRLVFLIWRPVGSTLNGRGAGYMIKDLDVVNSPQANWTYYMAIIIGIASVFIMRFVLRSKLGLGLAAIRDNDLTSASSGIDVFRVKLASFIIAAVVTGIAGAIYYIYQGYIEPNSAFSIRWTMIAILATVIGGIGIESGPIIGTAIVVLLHFTLAQYAGLSLLIQGVILVVIMVLAPHGIMGYIQSLGLGRMFRPAPRQPIPRETGE